MIELDANLQTQIESLLPAYLGWQPWYVGDESSAQDVAIVDSEWLHRDGTDVLWMLVQVGTHKFQIPIGLRPPARHMVLPGLENTVLGDVLIDAVTYIVFDALADRETALILLDIVTNGTESAHRTRWMKHQQSNTSVAYDERLVVKYFRPIQEGRNPDAEIPEALIKVGYTHVARPVGEWSRKGYDLAVAQEFMAGGSDAWDLAITSLRDMLASRKDPGDCGGDFAYESRRLGQMTARMHIALAEAFGIHESEPQVWADHLEMRLELLGMGDLESGQALVEAERKLSTAGPSIRLHADFHLGQIFRTDVGWFVMDFEGEERRPQAERLQPRTPLKNVIGVLRSYNYVAHVALLERDTHQRPALRKLVTAWEARNREYFLDGYFNAEGIAALMPPDEASRDLVMKAVEVKRACDELVYDREFRPAYAFIPEGALKRLLKD